MLSQQLLLHKSIHPASVAIPERNMGVGIGCLSGESRFAHEDVSSPVNTRTTTCSDGAFRGSYARELLCENIIQKCPQKPVPLAKTIHHINNTRDTKYETKLSREMFDPTAINTPPNEFMNNLKERLQLYFQT
jgi:hypothetical protein